MNKIKMNKINMEKGITNLRAFIDRNEKFIICSHSNPDGDAIGSEIAFSEFLLKKGKKAYILNSDPTPHNLDLLDPDNTIKVIKNEEDIFRSNIDPKDCAVVILDCKEAFRTGKAIEKLVINKAKESFIIDHHITEKVEENSIIITEFIATCEILYHIIKIHFETELNLKMAQALYVGIYTDSGSFVYQRTSASTFKIISELVSLGVQPNYIFKCVHQRDSLPKIKLIAKVLNEIKYYADGKIAVLIINDSIIESVGASIDDVEGNDIINMPLKAEKTLISVLCKERIEENGRKVVKISLRSKGDYNIRNIANLFGGGGHKNASGLKTHLHIEEITTLLTDELIKIL